MADSVGAFFDFDGTLIEGDSILYWLRFYYRRRPGRRWFQIANGIGMALFALRFLSSHTLKRIFFWPMSFEDPARLEALAAAFAREDLAFRLSRPVLERLWTHHYLGHEVVVISASAIFYLKHIQGILPPCSVLGTELEWRRGGLGLPRYRGGNLRGQNKVERLRAGGWTEAGRPDFAYSDHHHDLPLLRFVRFPVCVRPTRRLRRVARKNGWTEWDVPLARSPFRRKLEALCLLLWAWSPEHIDRAESAALPGKPRQDELPPFVRGQVRALRDLVKARDPGAKAEVFDVRRAPGAAAPETRPVAEATAPEIPPDEFKSK